MKRFVTWFIFLLGQHSFSQNSFVRNYCVWNEYSSHNFQQTSDGGYIISTDAVFEMDPNYANGKGYLIKTDNAGNTQWMKEYIKTELATKPSDGCSVHQCSDGGYIIAAAHYFLAGGSAIQFIRTDVSGNLLWTHLYPGGVSSAPECVTQTADGGYLACGHVQLSDGTTHPYLIKTDPAGMLQMGKMYSINNGYDGTATAARQTSDGGFVITGRFSGHSTFLLKTNASGVTVWIKEFTAVYGEMLTDVSECANSDLVATGHMNAGSSDALCVFRFSASGSLLWGNFYLGGNSYGNTIKETQVGNLIVAGSKNNRSALLLISGNGSFLWARRYGSLYIWTPIPVEAASDGGFAFLASSADNTLGWTITLVKTDPNGRDSCGSDTLRGGPVPVVYSLINAISSSDLLYDIPQSISLTAVHLNGSSTCYTNDSITWAPPVDSTGPFPCREYVFIPNVFTPNYDGLNEVFRDSVVTCDGSYKIDIYNRWGEKVFTSDVSTNHWNGSRPDGSEASDGTYYYVLKTKKRTYKGYLTLLR